MECLRLHVTATFCSNVELRFEMIAIRLVIKFASLAMWGFPESTFFVLLEEQRRPVLRQRDSSYICRQEEVTLWIASLLSPVHVHLCKWAKTKRERKSD
jgi:hypothetical protein